MRDITSSTSEPVEHDVHTHHSTYNLDAPWLSCTQYGSNLFPNDIFWTFSYKSIASKSLYGMELYGSPQNGLNLMNFGMTIQMLPAWTFKVISKDETKKVVLVFV